MTATNWTDEALMRRVDGEMTADESARLDADVAGDLALAGRLAAMRSLRDAARAAFPAAVDARDEALARMIAGQGSGQTRPGLWARLGEAFAPRKAGLWAGLAVAGFVAGVVLGPALGAGGSGDLVTREGVVAEAALVRVLDTGLAADGPDGDGRAVGLTFRDGEQRWCRTFDHAGAGMAGLACRDGDAWRIEALARSGPAGGEVRMASSETPAAVLAAVDAVMAEPALDPAQERAAREAGWR
ncbi:hypothetical protein GCM10009422_15500 [Brevundimonas kwangchunensis]|uniref:Anti-sigma factor n=1 Tax=Brevundimonas kwangchunensis TaxID=322163 RepID=A0ABN1GVB2_9CAUL